MLKKSLACMLMLSIVALSVASSGGKKKKGSAVEPAFTPLRSSGGFTLKSSPAYSGSHLLSTARNKEFTLYNSVVTYQRGNTIYVLPSQVKMNHRKPCFKSNLQMVDLKIRLKK
jgi:hypothetical protein